MRKILKELLDGKINIDTCEKLLKANNILELDEIAKFDNNREIRTGFPEAILAQGKEYDDLLTIIKEYFNKKNKNDKISVSDDENVFDISSNSVIITRLSKEKYDRLKEDLSYLTNDFNFEYNIKAKILKISINSNSYSKNIISEDILEDNENLEGNENKDNINNFNENTKKIGIITAGTSDIPVGEEARIVIEEGGCKAITSYDVGVAGIHRLFPQIAKMVKEGVCSIIVCAGMEGALPSVVAGLVDIPVIGVPTSVGYGIGGKGKAALYSMLQSCAPGLAVVNIDNGFGAGVFALTIAKNLK